MCRVRWFHNTCVPPHLVTMQAGPDLMCEVCLQVIEKARGVSSAIPAMETDPSGNIRVVGIQPAPCTASGGEHDLPDIRHVIRKHRKPQRTRNCATHVHNVKESFKVVNSPTTMDAKLAQFSPTKVWHNPMAAFELLRLNKRVKVCRGCRGKFLHDGSTPFIMRHKENNPFLDKRTGVQRESFGNAYYHCAIACILPRHPYFHARNVVVDLEVSREERDFLHQSGMIPPHAHT